MPNHFNPKASAAGATLLTHTQTHTQLGSTFPHKTHKQKISHTQALCQS